LITHRVVSVGCTLLFAGIGFGAVKLLRLLIVVVVGAFRLTRCASGSVPVFTDHLSTPHAKAEAEKKDSRWMARDTDRTKDQYLLIICAILLIYCSNVRSGSN